MQPAQAWDWSKVSMLDSEYYSEDNDTGERNDLAIVCLLLLLWILTIVGSILLNHYVSDWSILVALAVPFAVLKIYRIHFNIMQYFKFALVSLVFSVILLAIVAIAVGVLFPHHDLANPESVSDLTLAILIVPVLMFPLLLGFSHIIDLETKPSLKLCLICTVILIMQMPVYSPALQWARSSVITCCYSKVHFSGQVINCVLSSCPK